MWKIDALRPYIITAQVATLLAVSAWLAGCQAQEAEVFPLDTVKATWSDDQLEDITVPNPANLSRCSEETGPLAVDCQLAIDVMGMDPAFFPPHLLVSDANKICDVLMGFVLGCYISPDRMADDLDTLYPAGLVVLRRGANGILEHELEHSAAMGATGNFVLPDSSCIGFSNGNLEFVDPNNTIELDLSFEELLVRIRTLYARSHYYINEMSTSLDPTMPREEKIAFLTESFFQFEATTQPTPSPSPLDRQSDLLWEYSSFEDQLGEFVARQLMRGIIAAHVDSVIPFSSSTFFVNGERQPRQVDMAVLAQDIRVFLQSSGYSAVPTMDDATLYRFMASSFELSTYRDLTEVDETWGEIPDLAPACYGAGAFAQ